MSSIKVSRLVIIVFLSLILTSTFFPLQIAKAVSTPTVETRPATLISESAAMLNAQIVSDGGLSILERRFSWGTTSSCSDGWNADVGVSGDSFSYYLMGLNPGTTYYFQAWAKNSSGWSNSTAVSFTTTQQQTTPPTPNPPTALSPGSSSEGATIDNLTPTLTWTSVEGADYYAIAISEYPYGSSHIIYNPQQVYGTSISVPSGILSWGVRYRWNLQAHGPGGWSAVSNTIYFNTQQPTTYYTLSVNTQGHGSVNLSPSGGSYASETQVTLTAVPASGWQFDHWSGDLSGSQNPATITMNSNKSVTAIFVEQQTTPPTPNPPTALSPGSGSEGTTIDTLTPTLMWTSVEGVDYYAIAISEYPYGSSHIIYNPQQVYGTSISVPSGILSWGVRYRWNLQAHGPGGWSAVSNTLYFKTQQQTTDTTKPVVNSFSVNPSSVNLGSPFTISFSVSDSGGSGLKQVELWRANDSNASPGTWIQITYRSISGNSYSGSFTDTPSSAGTYWYGIHVVDNAGNWATESSPIRVTVDTSVVATPTFSPAGGTYTNSQTVSIYCSTSGATIRYTLNGSTPISSSTIYTGPITISSTTTIKAKAFKSGMTASAIASATYTISLSVIATPTFSPAGGTYTGTQSVSISCGTGGATIRYTINGSTPTSSSTIYSGPITVSSTTTIKAKAFKTGMTASAIASATYTISLSVVATPTFSPAGGTYTGTQSVSISCGTSGATIRYTLNGNNPTSSSMAYTGPITVSSTTTIKAKAFKTGMTDSSTASATYTISVSVVATPTFSPAAGTYTSPQTVSISCSTSGATIRYTLNGSTPTSSSTAYTSPITVSSTTTIKAKAFKTGMTASAIASATYTITENDVIRQAINYVIQLKGAKYLLGGKGWDYHNHCFTDATTIKTGYYYYNSNIGQVVFGQGIDCSGLIFWAFNKALKSTNYNETNPIPVNAHGQWKKYHDDSININNIKPGDLLFLDTPEGGIGYIDHVAMYIGNGKVIHSRGGKGVEELTLEEWFKLPTQYGKTYQYYFVGYGRYK